jgi:hypothetical protein
MGLRLRLPGEPRARNYFSSCPNGQGAERWPSGRRHQIANSVQPFLPDQVTPWNPCKSRVCSLLTSCQISPREIMLDTFGHLAELEIAVW